MKTIKDFKDEAVYAKKYYPALETGEGIPIGLDYFGKLIKLNNINGSNSLTIGIGAPSEAPDNPDTIYINEENWDLYQWDSELGEWVLKINGSTSTFGIVEENPTDAPEESEPWVVLNINTGLLWYYNGEAWVSQVSKNLQELFDENEGKADEGYNIINVVDQKLNFNGGASGEFGFYGAVGNIFSNSTSTGMTTKGRGQLSFNKTGPNILQNEGNNDGLQILGDAGPISINSQGSSINLSGAGAVVQSGGASATFGSGSLAISTSNSFNVQGSNDESILLQTGIATIEAPSRIILRRGEEGDGSSIVVDGIIDIKSVGNTNISTNGSPIALLVKDSDDEYTSGQLSVWGNYGVKISDSYYLPTSDGSAGQVITTDGGGVLGWADTSPSQLELVNGAGTDKGWRLLGQSVFKGVPGNNSVDLGVAESGSRGATGDYSAVGGGYNNTASNDYSAVGGGYNNKAIGGQSVVGGGYSNTASASSSTVSGGFENIASGNYSAVSGGYTNIASGNYSAVSGGEGNIANEHSSFTIGRFSEGGTVQTTWISGSPIFKVGNGTSNANRSNAYTLNNDGTSIQSGIASYEGDYSENFTDRSLVDKGYVDSLVNSRLSEAQRAAINALVSPETDYDDMTEVTAAIKAVIDALQA